MPAMVTDPSLKGGMYTGLPLSPPWTAQPPTVSASRNQNPGPFPLLEITSILKTSSPQSVPLMPALMQSRNPRGGLPPPRTRREFVAFQPPLKMRLL